MLIFGQVTSTKNESFFPDQVGDDFKKNELRLNTKKSIHLKGNTIINTGYATELFRTAMAFGSVSNLLVKTGKIEHS